MSEGRIYEYNYGISCRGDTVDSFEFLDLSPAVKAMSCDARYTHDCQVRGREYMEDRVKVPAGPALSRMIAMDVFRVDTDEYGERHDHIARIGKSRERVKALLQRVRDLHSVLVFNLQIPGSPPASMVFYFAVPNSSRSSEKGFAMYERFLDFPLTDEGTEPEEDMHFLGSDGDCDGATDAQCVREKIAPFARHTEDGVSDNSNDDAISVSRNSSFSSASSSQRNISEKGWLTDIVWPPEGSRGVLSQESFQNKRFKLVPRMLESPWIMQMTVKSTPVMIGQKVVQRYFRGVSARYVEVDLCVGSSRVADNIVSLCRSYSTTFTVNICVVLQGECEEELPEEVLCAGNILYADLEKAEELEE